MVLFNQLIICSENKSLLMKPTVNFPSEKPNLASWAPLSIRLYIFLFEIKNR